MESPLHFDGNVLGGLQLLVDHLRYIQYLPDGEQFAKLETYLPAQGFIPPCQAFHRTAYHKEKHHEIQAGSLANPTAIPLP